MHFVKHTKFKASVQLWILQILLLSSFRFTNGFVYYGLSLHSSNLGGDPFINYFLVALAEIPAVLLMTWALFHITRIKLYSINFIAAGVALLAIIPTPSGINFTYYYVQYTVFIFLAHRSTHSHKCLD